MNKKLKIISIVGARPQFIKLFPFSEGLKKEKKSIKHIIIHTGQHYDYLLSQSFFNELKLPKPDYNLNIGSSLSGDQTGKMLSKIEEVLIKTKPDLVVVFGDTNSTLAGALAASKLHIGVAHIEAGLRSFNKRMPEEINRILTDHCSKYLFCPTLTAVRNLRNEGFKNILNNGTVIRNNSKIEKINQPTVINVGDIMFESINFCINIAEKKSKILNQLNLSSKKYFLATIHRAENTNCKNNLINILEALAEINKIHPVVFPMHPRTKNILLKLKIFNQYNKLFTIIEPVKYFDMLKLQKHAKIALTDSGGVQKEAYLLKTPCLTLREETEWVETLENGWNILTGTNKEKIINNCKEMLKKDQKKFTDKNANHFGIGDVTKKIIKCLGK